MSEQFTRVYTRDDGETEVTVDFNVTSWGSPAHMGSLTYAGDPGDPMEVEIDACTLASDSQTKVVLTDAERERFEMAFLEDPPEDDGGDPYDDDWDR